MADQEYWNQFVKTGNIYDYLTYTACTREDKYQGQQDEDKVKVGERESDVGRGDRDGPVYNAYR